MATVAFLGLGIMGAPMAVNLVHAGFDVVGWNRTLSKATPVKEAGGSVAKTPAEAVEGADFILSILDSGPVVRAVFFDSGAVDHMKSGAIFIDPTFPIWRSFCEVKATERGSPSIFVRGLRRMPLTGGVARPCRLIEPSEA